MDREQRENNGGHPRGENNGHHLLTVADVKAIHASRASHAEEARKYGVDRSTISMIRSGQRWGWLQQVPAEEKP